MDQPKIHLIQICGIVAGITLFCTLVFARAGNERVSFRLPDVVPAPADNKVTPERVELGKRLFFDPRLSGSNWISCATCHNPALGWADGLPTAKGDGMHDLARATPSIVNAAFNKFQMWDGRFNSLEEQAWGPMLASAEMHGNSDGVLTKLRAIPGYDRAFEKA